MSDSTFDPASAKDPARATITVRTAVTLDADGILDCLRAAFQPYREHYTAPAFADTVLTSGTLAERLEVMQVFVATSSDGGIVGTLACSAVGEGEGHLRGMAVLPDWQGRGVAGALLTAAETHLASRGCTHITLDTTLPLVRAASFYAARGYRASGRSRDFFGMRLVEYSKTL